MTFALGISAALVAPFMMVLGFVIWDNHWTGSAFSLNMYKCNLAAIGFAMVSICSWYSLGFSPDGVFTKEKVGFLMLSSTIGILIGDWTWLEGMRLLGARKVIVMDSLKPFLAALLGKLILEEKLNPAAYLGLMLTVLGVSLVGFEKEATHEKSDAGLDQQHTSQFEVVLETDYLIPKPTNNNKTAARSESYAEQRKNKKQSTQETLYGLMMGFLNVVLHTFGALLTKKYGVGMTTWEINAIRFGFAGLCMLLLSTALHLPSMFKQGAPSNNKSPWYSLPRTSMSSWIPISLGVGFVSFLQPALTNYAMFQISLALLLTLESIGPLYSLPLALVWQNERPTFRACLGAIFAVTGIVVLSYKGMIEEAAD